MINDEMRILLDLLGRIREATAVKTVKELPLDNAIKPEPGVHAESPCYPAYHLARNPVFLGTREPDGEPPCIEGRKSIITVLGACGSFTAPFEQLVSCSWWVALTDNSIRRRNQHH